MVTIPSCWSPRKTPLFALAIEVPSLGHNCNVRRRFEYGPSADDDPHDGGRLVGGKSLSQYARSRSWAINDVRRRPNQRLLQAMPMYSLPRPGFVDGRDSDGADEAQAES